MLEENVIYNIDGIEYSVRIIRKRIKNSYLKYSKIDECFILTTNRLTSLRSLDSFIRKSIPRLAKARNKEVEKPYDDKYVYILGEKQELNFADESELQKYLKSNLLPLAKERVLYYENVMGITNHFSVKVRNNSTRFGSNSKGSHSLSFSTCLYHFPLEVIDSVVIHELAHYFYFDHSKRFWGVVYKYCPNYKMLRAKLIKKNYGKDI